PADGHLWRDLPLHVEPRVSAYVLLVLDGDEDLHGITSTRKKPPRKTACGKLLSCLITRVPISSTAAFDRLGLPCRRRSISTYARTSNTATMVPGSSCTPMAKSSAKCRSGRGLSRN